MIDHLLYALAWASFGCQHSWLARPSMQARLEAVLGRCHRLAYNTLATIHFGLVLALGLWLFGFAFPLPWPARAFLFALAVAGSALMAATLARRDLGLFLGLRQLREPAAREEGLDTEGVYRWVRHPLYAGMLLLFWGLAQSEFGLATALWASVYIVIGAWLEERDLLARFGAEYRDYCRRVPMLVPWQRS